MRGNSISKKTSLVILAAGMGSRYGGLKQLDGFGPNGETILDYSIHDAIKAGITKIVFIIRESFRQEMEDLFVPKLEGKADVFFVEQDLHDLPNNMQCPVDREKPWGTAHAVWAARHVVSEPFAVINADDYYGIGAFEIVHEFLHGDNSAKDYAIVSYKLEKTLSEHGTVNRGVCQTNDGVNLTSIHERLKIGYDEYRKIFFPSEEGPVFLAADTPVSMNFWGFYPDYFTYCTELFTRYLADNLTNPKAEFFIPLLVEELLTQREKNVRLLTCDAEWFGVTYREDKPFVQERIAQLIDLGVYPQNLWK